MLTEQPKRSHELSKWYKMSNWRLVCRNHDFHKKRSPIYGLKNFCLIVKWRNCLKKSFWNMAAKLKLRVKHEWQKKTKKDWHQKPPKKSSPNLPSLLPLLTDFWSWLKWVRLVCCSRILIHLFFNFCLQSNWSSWPDWTSLHKIKWPLPPGEAFAYNDCFAWTLNSKKL